MRPRKYIKTAFKTVYWRFGIFFIGGALAVGIILPWNDPTLDNVVSQGTPTSSMWLKRWMAEWEWVNW